MTQCPLCESTNVKAVSDDPLDMIWRINCKICGGYILTSRAKGALGSKDIRGQKAKISAYVKQWDLRGLPPVMLMLEGRGRIGSEPKITLTEAISQFPENILDRVDRALINLGRLSKHTGDTVRIHPELHYPIMYADTRKKESTEFMIHSLRDLGFIQGKWTSVNYDITITPRGWQHIYEIQRGAKIDVLSRVVFVGNESGQLINMINVFNGDIFNIEGTIGTKEEPSVNWSEDVTETPDR